MASTDADTMSINGESGVLSLNRSEPTRSLRDCSVLLCHGFPSSEISAEHISAGVNEMLDKFADRLGCVIYALSFRGCGTSEGDFSLAGWLNDLKLAANHCADAEGTGVWVVGFGTGGALGVVAAAESSRIEGVVAVSAPADFDDWAANPDELLAFSRTVGAIRSRDFPQDKERWESELREIRAVSSAGDLGEKPLLVMHGSEDEVVPHFDARLIADSHGMADLKFVLGGSHALRQDPRAEAILIGWLDAQTIGHGDVSGSTTSSKERS